MTRFALLLILFVVAARLFWRFVDAVVRGAIGAQAPQGRRTGTPMSVKMQPCAVCGTYVVPGKAIGIVSGGSPVYFCSEKCRGGFQPR